MFKFQGTIAQSDSLLELSSLDNTIEVEKTIKPILLENPSSFDEISPPASPLNFSRIATPAPSEHFDFISKNGCLPLMTPISQEQLERIYILIDEIFYDPDYERRIAIILLLQLWEQEFNQSPGSCVWGPVKFGYKDKRPAQATKDKKSYIQFSHEYFNWIKENDDRSGLLDSYPNLSELYHLLDTVYFAADSIYRNELDSIFTESPEKISRFFYENTDQKSCLTISIRVISYEESHQPNTRFHYDKSAFGLLFSSDDLPEQECLLIAPPKIDLPPSLSDLRQVVRPKPSSTEESCALMLSGVLLEKFGLGIPPTAHLVLPHYRPRRHVLVAFLNIPNLHLEDPALCSGDFNILPKGSVPLRFMSKFKGQSPLIDVLKLTCSSPLLDRLSPRPS